MGDQIIGMLQFALFTFLASVVAGVTITVVTNIYCAYIRFKGKDQILRGQIASYARIVTGFQDRLEQRKSAAAGAASGLFSAQRMDKQLRQRLRDLEKEPYHFVRMVGAEQHPNRPYEILATNTSVAHQVKRGERHAFFDSSWALTVTIHVWAKSADEANMEFERVFPRAAGFKLLHTQALPGVGAGVQKTESSPAGMDAEAGGGDAPASAPAGAEDDDTAAQLKAVRSMLRPTEMPA